MRTAALLLAGALLAACGNGGGSDAVVAAKDSRSAQPSGTSVPATSPRPAPRPTTASAATRPTPHPTPAASTITPAGTASASPARTVTPRPDPTPTTSGHPGVITEDDYGRTFTFRVGEEAELRLGGGYRWSQPEVSSDAVRLTQIQFVRDPGYSAWVIRAERRGDAKITSQGDLPCHDASPPCMAPSRLFEVTIKVV